MAEDHDVAILRSDPIIRRYLPIMPESISAEEVGIRREKRAQMEDVVDLQVFLCTCDPPKFVGVTGLYDIDEQNKSCCIGILIASERFREGLATETLYTLMQYAFEDEALHMHRLTFHTAADNVQMQGWLENVVGAVQEFRYREAWKSGDKWVNTVGYSVLDREWRESVKEKLEKRLQALN